MLHDPRTVTALHRLLWAVAVICLGTWGWARLDAARFQAAADRELDGTLAASAAAVEAHEIEQAVERQLAGAPPAGAALAQGATSADAGSGAPAPAGRPAERNAVPTADAPAGAIVGATEVLGRLRMPRIGLSVVVAEGVDRRTLRRAAGRIPGTAPLGSDGNVGIAGHRDGVFHDLRRAAAGDLLLLDTPRGTERYEVEAVRIVAPDATAVLADDGRPRLTLVTCYPFERLGPAPERWVVRARRIQPTQS